MDYYIEVDKKENANVRLIAQIDKILTIEEVEKYIQENLQRHFEAYSFARYSHQLYETRDHIIFEYEVHYEEDWKLDIRNFGEFNLGGFASSHQRVTPIYKRHTLFWNYEIPDEHDGYVNKSLITEDIDLNVHLNIPFKIKEHNAQAVDEDTLTWRIDHLQNNNIKVVYVKNDLYYLLFIPFFLLNVFFYKNHKEMIAILKEKYHIRYLM